MLIRTKLIHSLTVLAAVCLIGTTANAERRHDNDEPPMAMSPIDCSVLSGTPYICVRNPGHASITGIACTGFWGTTAMSLPGAVIPSGGTSIVKFAGKCEKVIKITKRDGTSFEIQGFDVNTNTILNAQDN